MCRNASCAHRLRPKLLILRVGACCPGSRSQQHRPCPSSPTEPDPSPHCTGNPPSLRPGLRVLHRVPVPARRFKPGLPSRKTVRHGDPPGQTRPAAATPQAPPLPPLRDSVSELTRSWRVACRKWAAWPGPGAGTGRCGLRRRGNVLTGTSLARSRLPGQQHRLSSRAPARSRRPAAQGIRLPCPSS